MRSEQKTLAFPTVDIKPSALDDIFSNMDNGKQIAIFSDLHIPFGLEHKEAILDDRAWLDMHDAVILLGDNIACYGTPGEYDKLNDFINRLNKPYTVIHGNHEFNFESVPDESPFYGEQWQNADIKTKYDKLEQFKLFFGLTERYHSSFADGMTIITAGFDDVSQDGQPVISYENWQWICSQLRVQPDVPAVVFCHMPLDFGSGEFRYYSPDRKPFLSLPSEFKVLIAERRSDVLWFSGHIHLMPSHDMFKPYEILNGLWQLHCPDSWGFGRPDNKKWKPVHHDSAFSRSLCFSSTGLQIKLRDHCQCCVVEEFMLPYNKI